MYAYTATNLKAISSTPNGGPHIPAGTRVKVTATLGNSAEIMYGNHVAYCSLDELTPAE